MQFSKFMPLVCAAAFCAGFISARADDTPAQAAARAALEQKMRDLDTQEASTNIAAPPAIVVTPSGAAQEQYASPAAVETSPVIETPSAATLPSEAQPVVATIPAGSDPQAAARAALDQKMHELDAQQPATNVEITLPVIMIAPTETQTLQTSPMQAPGATPPPADGNYPGKELGLQPIAPPALPISADKEAQLQALLAKYKADEVSPEEYHKQRAAILAEP